jgi:hypothetical protein
MRRRSRQGQGAPSPAAPLPPGHFEVLCRFDAYADYIAIVEADNATEAAEFARDNHNEYKWTHVGTAEFDACLHVTLDPNGCEIEETEIRDF